MEYRRCRKVLAISLTTAIILSVSVPNVFAFSDKSLETYYQKAVFVKESVFEDFLSNVQRMVFANPSVSQLASQQIRFVIEEISEEDLDSEKAVTAFAPQLGKVAETEQAQVKKAQEAGARESKAREAKPRESKAQVKEESSRGGKNILQEELDLLARIIHAEARGESFEGQVAVGAVVLNRVEHPDFPKTIKEVIYQPGQFTAVDDHQIKLEPDQVAYQAAKAALEGQDPSNGAIFYYNPKIATDSWIKTRSIIKRIGNHRFCV